MVSFLGLPMVKLGGLVLRTLTKPLAKRIKAQSREHPQLNDVCHELGQRQNRALVRIDMRLRRVHDNAIPELPRDEAVANGADLLGELLIFAVAVAVASNEYARSSAKARATKLANERETEARFKRVEHQVLWLERKLKESGYTLQHDYASRFREEDAEQSIVPDFEETIDALDDAREQYLGINSLKFDETLDDPREQRRQDAFWRFEEKPPSGPKAPLQRDFGFPRFGKMAGEARAHPRVEHQHQHQREHYDFPRIREPLREPRMPLREPGFPRLGGVRL
ncbi:hypothetical protein PybrP1_012447 [[Pythium] brassicae (nom. inval.)]|nr:hypothetical protein PybrP1_012447 [[Pythium] brassicae (nom. inval.)]